MPSRFLKKQRGAPRQKLQEDEPNQFAQFSWKSVGKSVVVYHNISQVGRSMIGQHDYTSMNNLDISRHRHAMRYTWIHRSTDGLKDRDTDG